MSKGKVLAVCVVWLVVAGIGAVVWRLVVRPAQDAERDATIAATGSESHYEQTVRLALDSFSGYAVLRSPEMRSALAAQKTKLVLVDDGANYRERIAALRAGDVQLATFTIDALLKVCAELQDLPATIIAVLDETRGADAMVAYKDAVPDLNALNRPEMRFVLTLDSPSETLAHVVRSDFNLDQLPDDSFDGKTSAEEVYRAWRSADHRAPRAYVMWEPFVSRALENPNAHVLVDSSRFRGYIVDVLVANRDFLRQHGARVEGFVRAYFQAYHSHHRDMKALVLADAVALGTPLKESQAQRLVDGVWWKNTQENFAHLGLPVGKSLQHLEDMISNIMRVLIERGVISRDPTRGKPHLLYYRNTLQQLHSDGYHPGVTPEAIRDDDYELPALSEREWRSVAPVGTLEVAPLMFRRGTEELQDRDRTALDDVVNKLRAWPQYYLTIQGNASRRGDLEANKELARRRAIAARDYLIAQGIGGNRMQAIGVEPRDASSVEFIFGQQPYEEAVRREDEPPCTRLSHLLDSRMSRRIH